MKSPFLYRKDIPFFYNKSKEEYHHDVYERFDPMVLRQTMIHLQDDLWKGYPFKPVKDFLRPYLEMPPDSILEVGCGVGRLIGDLAIDYPQSRCWGIDYSYQMLKRAQEFWKGNQKHHVDLSRYGFSQKTVFEGKRLTNVHFGLSKCESLPFDDNSQELVFSSFLFDRLADPINGLIEMKRVCKSGGKIILLTPMNFTSRMHWEQFYPASKLKDGLLNNGFEILDWQEGIKVDEPMDGHGNVIQWQCVGMVLK